MNKSANLVKNVIKYPVIAGIFGLLVCSCFNFNNVNNHEVIASDFSEILDLASVANNYGLAVSKGQESYIPNHGKYSIKINHGSIKGNNVNAFPYCYNVGGDNYNLSSDGVALVENSWALTIGKTDGVIYKLTALNDIAICCSETNPLGGWISDIYFNVYIKRSEDLSYSLVESKKANDSSDKTSIAHFENVYLKTGDEFAYEFIASDITEGSRNIQNSNGSGFPHLSINCDFAFNKTIDTNSLLMNYFRGLQRDSSINYIEVSGSLLSFGLRCGNIKQNNIQKYLRYSGDGSTYFQFYNEQSSPNPSETNGSVAFNWFLGSRNDVSVIFIFKANYDLTFKGNAIDFGGGYQDAYINYWFVGRNMDEYLLINSTKLSSGNSIYQSKSDELNLHRGDMVCWEFIFSGNDWVRNIQGNMPTFTFRNIEITTDFKEYQNAAVYNLANYKSPDLFREYEKAQLLTYINRGSTLIYAFNSKENIDATLNKYKASIDLLKTAQDYIDEEAVNNVTQLINAIGDVKFTPECGQRIYAARSAYDKLTNSQKGKVSSEIVNKLIAAENSYYTKELYQHDAVSDYILNGLNNINYGIYTVGFYHGYLNKLQKFTSYTGKGLGEPEDTIYNDDLACFWRWQIRCGTNDDAILMIEANVNTQIEIKWSTDNPDGITTWADFTKLRFIVVDSLDSSYRKLIKDVDIECYRDGKDGIYDCSLSLSQGQKLYVIYASNNDKSGVINYDPKICADCRLYDELSAIDFANEKNVNGYREEKISILEYHVSTFNVSQYRNLKYTEIINYLAKFIEESLDCENINEIDDLYNKYLSMIDSVETIFEEAKSFEIDYLLAPEGVVIPYNSTTMTMADRIVVMKDGVVQQIGAAKVIYSNPVNLFVATFIGSPAMNILKGYYSSKGVKLSNDVTIELNKNLDVKSFLKNEIKRLNNTVEELNNALLNPKDINVVVYKSALEKADSIIQKFENKLKCDNFELYLGIRPEHIMVLDNNDKKYDTEIKVEIIEMLGSETYIHTHIGDSPLVIKTINNRDINVGDSLKIKFDIDKTHYFDIDTEESVGK